MIRWQRSIRSAGSKALEAVQWAKEVTDYVNGKQPNYKVQAFSSRFGDGNILVWQADFENLMDLDKYQHFFNTDQGYWGLIQKAVDLFMEGTQYDSVFETL
jgi:hypothetical protein